jgi:CO dehydrogenase nickel-insertion accessory protein CooC1
MSENRRPLKGKRLGIFGKGGSGKSTVTLLLAYILRQRGYEVCLMDADSTNVGLHEMLGIDTPPLSLIDYYGGMVFHGGAVSCPVDDPTPLAGAERSLEDLPAPYHPRSKTGIHLLAAGKIGDLGPGAGCDGPISKIARDFRITSEGIDPVTLLDFKAGFEDSARGVITHLDWVVVVVDPTKAAIQMAIHMKNMIHQIAVGKPPATEHLESPELVALAQKLFREANIKDMVIVLNRVRNDDMENVLREKLGEKSLDPIGAIHEDPSIALNWLHGTPIESKDRERETIEIVDNLETILIDKQ